MTPTYYLRQSTHSQVPEEGLGMGPGERKGLCLPRTFIINKQRKDSFQEPVSAAEVGWGQESKVII